MTFLQQALMQQQQQAMMGQEIAPIDPNVKPFPWLTVIGLGAGAIAVYFVYQHYTGTKKLGTIERPEPEDYRPRLRRMGKSLSHFKGRSSGCRQFGNADKYEFEPEIRLEGFRRGPRGRKSRSTRRSK